MELSSTSTTLLQSNIDDSPFKSDLEVSAEVARGDNAVAANVVNNKHQHQDDTYDPNNSISSSTTSSPTKFRRYPRLGSPAEDTGTSQFYFSIGYAILLSRSHSMYLI